MDSQFRKELESLINKHSRENGSNTPDFILAHFLNDCLEAFDQAVNGREEWHGRKSANSEGDFDPESEADYSE